VTTPRAIHLEEDKDNLRAGFLEYTRKAFRMLPTMDRPRILDIGCGSGIPTLELARLSDGEITGIDIDQHPLDKLKKRIEETGLSDRITTVKGSMLEMDFPEGSFDIIWAEGCMHTIGFERALRDWYRFLRPNGFIVIHDVLGNVQEKRGLITLQGYDLVGHLPLPDDAWLDVYYGPLEKLVKQLRVQHHEDAEVSRMLDKEQREIEVFKKDPVSLRTGFFIIQKRV